MKKYIILLFIILLSFSLFGCSAQSNESDVTESKTEVQTEAPTIAPTEVAIQTEAPTLNLQEMTEPPRIEETEQEPTAEPDAAEPILQIDVNGNTFYADFEDNTSAEALKEKLREAPLTLEMHDYGGFEKVGDLPFTLVTNDTQITTEPGDVILYQGNELTIYYDTNTWSFTKIAKIRNADSGLKEQLGEGNITVTFSLTN